MSGKIQPHIGRLARQGPSTRIVRGSRGRVTTQADLRRRLGTRGALAVAQQASQQAGNALARANAAMDEAKLASLRVVATGRINLAYTAYVSACRDIRESIKAAAKQNAEMMALILEVAMGFTTPGLSRWVVGIANRIPVDSSTAAYRVALAALDSDRVKAVLTGATKTAQYTLKSHAMELAGETDIDTFVGSLETYTQSGFQKLIDGLLGMSAVEVGTVTAAFDASVVNRNVYRTEIKRLTDMYERQVSPIGATQFTFGEGAATSFAPEAAWVKDGGSQRLAIVSYRSMGLFGLGDFYFLHSWVDAEMKDIVVKRQLATFGKIETIDKSDVKTFR